MRLDATADAFLHDPTVRRIVSIAARLTRQPLAAIFVPDTDRDFLLAGRCGLVMPAVPRDASPLAAIEASERAWTTTDLGACNDHANWEPVREAPGLARFAGVPVFRPSGSLLGVLAVMDTVPGRPCFGWQAALVGCAALLEAAQLDRTWQVGRDLADSDAGWIEALHAIEAGDSPLPDSDGAPEPAWPPATAASAPEPDGDRTADHAAWQQAA